MSLATQSDHLKDTLYCEPSDLIKELVECQKYEVNQILLFIACLSQSYSYFVHTSMRPPSIPQAATTRVPYQLLRPPPRLFRRVYLADLTWAYDQQRA
jgi:UDP-N-acetyl-D-mannosaminuronic acid transferase (WecB/TagA/CpsF family)